MKKTVFVTLAMLLSGATSYAQQILGDFTGANASEWPKVVWYRDTGNNWDEGLIKNGAGESALGRGGFGIHMHESRMFTFWSTSWTPLLSIQGGTGNLYIRGNTGVGTMTPEVKLQVKSDNAGTGANTNNWIAGSFGGQAGTRVVLGNLYGTATIGAHTDSHNGWANLAINTDGGNVGIGTATPDAKLAVRGTIHTQEVKVDMNGWADYVFKPTYKLPELKSIKAYIVKNQHLPEVPSEAEVAKNGVSLGEMNKTLLKKVEELTLYIIEQEAQLNNLKENTVKVQLLQQQQIDKLTEVINNIKKR